LPVVALLASLWSCRPAAEEGGVRRADQPLPNIVFILVDTLRADRLGAYGHSAELTPTMDALAAEGVIFDQAISAAPWTQPAVASLFCSYYPQVHQVLRYDRAVEGAFRGGAQLAVFDDRFRTLAERLREAGYQTAGFSANPFVVEKYGFAQGFEHYDSSFAMNTTPGNVVNDAALAWLEQRDTKRPFFLYLHYMDVHGPYLAGPEYLEPLLDAVEKRPNKRLLTLQEQCNLLYLGKHAPHGYSDLTRLNALSPYREYWVARYEAGVAEVDHHLGELRAALEQRGLWNDTYVVLTADHGEALCEHGFWDHGLSANHNQLHVPLILRWPGVLPGGQHVGGWVRLIDVMPTLLAQLRLPPVAGVQGESLVPLLRDPAAGATRAAFAECVKLGPEQKALYLGSHKLLVQEGEPRGYLLFDVGTDPGEQRPLTADQAGETLRTLNRRLDEQIRENRRMAASFQAERTGLTAEERRRLEGIGYAGATTDNATRPVTSAPVISAPVTSAPSNRNAEVIEGEDD